MVEAKGLLAEDTFSGKSDPYCVVYFNGKKVGKTSTIDNTTFPRWNEDFVIQLPESGEGLLRCELYDHDMFGATECETCPKGAQLCPDGEILYRATRPAPAAASTECVLDEAVAAPAAAMA